MAITLRTLTDDGATTKGAALTHSELDQNFVDLIGDLSAKQDAEGVRDTVATALQAGANVQVTVDDAGNIITIATDALDEEQVQDAVGAMVTAGANISATYDDVAGTLTLAMTGLTLAEISDSGTAAALNVPASGDAAAGEVVKGDDSRLTDPRTSTAHKGSHATGGSDAIAPADIGAATAAQGAKADSAVQPADTSFVSGDAGNDLTQNPKFWEGTQAEYDAIETPDANTLYFIT